MALDHYVSQVHLRKFYAPALDRRQMYATRKCDLMSFPCGSEDVCRLEQGSSTPFLNEPRAVEEFLKLVEPRYSAACRAFENGEPSRGDVFAIAGFAAFVVGCSPTAVRVGATSLRETVRVEAAILDRIGQLPASPPELGGRTLSELLDEGAVEITIDPKFPQALGVSTFIDVTASLGNFAWDVLINPIEDSPFFTSDYPVGLERGPDPAIMIKVVPLTPHLAVRIFPRILRQEECALSFSHFRFRRRAVSRREVRAINRTIVRSAENLVFHAIQADWIPKFIYDNSPFRIEAEVTTFPSDTGFLILTRTAVRECERTDG